jgi:hypothetical protein
MILATLRRKDGSLLTAVESDSETESESDSEVKIIEPKKKTESVGGWAYVGSHNFTPSAWGNLSGSAFGPIMNVRRLVIRTRRYAHSASPDHEFRDGHSIFPQRRERSRHDRVLGAAR